MTERHDLDEYKLVYDNGNEIILPRGIERMHVTGGLLKDGAFHPEVYQEDWSVYRGMPFSYHIPVDHTFTVRRVA